jgi:hypothetical protein
MTRLTEIVKENIVQGVGVWNSTTTYPQGCLAKGSDKKLYEAINENSNSDPITKVDWKYYEPIFENGSESSPSISFGSDMDTGLFRKQTNSIAVSTGGTERMVVTSLGRVGIGEETPKAKLHVIVDDDVTAGIRSTCAWTGTTAAPYQNNDTTLFETRNKVISDSTNFSWSVSADNGSNDIPVGVTDLGFRKGVYGWAVSKDDVNGKHDGTLALQMGIHGLAGFLGVGNACLGTVTEAIGVRGEINHDAAAGTIETAIAVEAISVASTGTVNNNYAIRCIALNGAVQNWSFHGDGGKLFNQDQANFGSKYNDLSGSVVSARGVNNAIEFGFPDVGYGSALGSTPVEGNPFISFCAEIQAGDTWKTQGKAGFAVVNQLNAGSLIFGKLTNPSAAGQSLTESLRIDQNNRVQFQQTPIIPGFTPASASDTGQTGQVSWDSEYIYICIGTNTWKRVAIATW